MHIIQLFFYKILDLPMIALLENQIGQEIKQEG